MIRRWQFKQITNRQFASLLQHYHWLYILFRTGGNRYIASCLIGHIKANNPVIIPPSVDEEHALMERGKTND